MKPSDEQIVEANTLGVRHAFEVIERELFGRRDAIFYIEASDLALLIEDAKRIGRESMREECLTCRPSTEELIKWNSKTKGLEITEYGKGRISEWEIVKEAIRNLPISGGDNND